MAKKMRRDETGHTVYRTDSKKIAYDIFKALKDKKKIPRIPYPKNLIRKNDEYRNMSVSQFEKKHPWK